MSNLIIWTHQATVDYNYRVRGALGEIVTKILARQLLNQAEQLLKEVQQKGLRLDTKLPTTGFPNMPNELEAIKDLLRKGGHVPEVQIGGDPAIAAMRGHFLKLPGSTDLPEVWYAGLYPNSVKTVLENGEVDEADAIRENIFRIKYDVPQQPQSIGLEADVHKLIIVYGPGRSISEVAPDGTFTDFITRVERELKKVKDAPKRIIIAVNAAHPEMMTVSDQALRNLDDVAEELLTEYNSLTKANENEREEFKKSLININKDEKRVSEIVYLMRLLKDVKKAPFGIQVCTFMATRYLRKPTGEVDTHLAQAVFLLLKGADIISANEAEIHDLHTIYRGEFHEIPLAYKLRELPFKAIKVCHSADGVIMDLGCRPEHIITSERFREDPAGFLEEVLRLSADGATYGMDATAGLGRSANEAMIRIYSRNIRDEGRQHERFRATFLDITEPMPAGMISVASARVVRTLGAVVGLGAVFDGLLLSFLLRD